MKTLLFSIASFFIFLDSGYCQLKQIPVSKIVYLQEKNLRCLDDSANAISKTCSLDLDGFKIKFYALYLDKSKKEVQLIGRVCMSGEANSPGISGVEIFKATKAGNNLSGHSSIGETTNGNKLINNDGFFDITLTVEKNESLFFYSQRYYLKEFTVFKLLQ